MRFIKGKPHKCFGNVFRACSQDDSLTYVEGYIDLAIPIHHAWALDRDGGIVECTLTDTVEADYRQGIAFTRKEVGDRLTANKGGMPLMTTEELEELDLRLGVATEVPDGKGGWMAPPKGMTPTQYYREQGGRK